MRYSDHTHKLCTPWIVRRMAFRAYKHGKEPKGWFFPLILQPHKKGEFCFEIKKERTHSFYRIEKFMLLCLILQFHEWRLTIFAFSTTCVQESEFSGFVTVWSTCRLWIVCFKRNRTHISRLLPTFMLSTYYLSFIVRGYGTHELEHYETAPSLLKYLMPFLISISKEIFH